MNNQPAYKYLPKYDYRNYNYNRYGGFDNYQDGSGPRRQDNILPLGAPRKFGTAFQIFGGQRIFIQDNHLQKQRSIKDLVIYSKLPEIIDAIKKSMITIVRVDTGSGKTIGVPNYLSKEKYFTNGIFCSVPTIAATISAAKYQSDIIGIRNYVGYACEGNVNYYHNTRIVYCTTGHLLNKMVRTVSNIIKKEKNIYWFCSVLVLDEFHVRTKESDICLCLWISAYKMWKNNPAIYPKPPKLVIMSATLDDTIKILLPTEPSVLSYAVQTHPIKIVYDDQASTRNYNIDDDELYLRTVSIAQKYHNDKYDGVYLIFVPGKQELELIQTELEKYFGPNADIYIAHGDLSIDELVMIHNRPKDGIRKIVVATNIAECSITIENVSLVIDTMTHREASSSLDESLKLDLHWISKANSKQRMGRTGRTCPGIYIPLVSEEKYSTLTDNITPELERVSISYDILKLLKFELDPKIILAPIISMWQIDIHIDLLKKLRFIREPEKTISKLSLHPHNKIIVTDMGDFCSEFPLSIRKSAMLYHLKNLREPNSFIYLAVICTLNCYGAGLFYMPKKNKGEDAVCYELRREDAKIIFEDKFAGYSDVDTIFNIWIELCATINPFYITDLRNFCRDNQLNFRRFKNTVTILKQCMIVCNRMALRVSHNVKTFIRPNLEELSRTFYNLLALTHHDYITTVHYNFTGDVTAICGGLQHKIDNRAIHQMELGNNMRQVYYALVRTQKTTRNGYVLRIINVLHSIPQDDVDEDTPSIFSSDIDSDTDSELSGLDIPIQAHETDFVRSSSQPILIKTTKKQKWTQFLELAESTIPCDESSSSDGSMQNSPSDNKELVCRTNNIFEFD